MDNKLIVLVGLPGSGKTTLAKKLCESEDYVRISSDDIREELFGFRDQTHNDEVFAELDKRVIERSAIGNCIYDATSLSKKTRKKICNKFYKYYSIIKCICILRPINELIEINNTRKNTKEYIPEDVLSRIFTRFELPTADEGFDSIDFHLVTSTDKQFKIADVEDVDHDNPHHNQTLKEHILLTTGAAFTSKSINRDLLETLAYYHDFGKFYCRKYNEEKGYTQYIGHANISAYIYLTDIAIIAKFTNYASDNNVPLFHRHYFMYYAILYHDAFYSMHEEAKVLKSLSKPSKSICSIFSEDEIIELVGLLKEFNVIDSLRY